jgi:phage shock protein E
MFVVRYSHWFVAIMVLSVGSTLTAAETTKDSLATVKKNVTEKKAVLVDVRDKSEWDQGHIEGSIFLPVTALKKGIDAKRLAKILPKDKILYTFCVVGKRSLTAAQILEKAGYKVRSLKPGYKELVKAGFKKADDKKRTAVSRLQDNRRPTISARHAAERTER